jgi:hypothetical protein
VAEKTKLLYMMHPVSGGRYHTTRAWLKLLNEALNPHNVAVVCPWLPQVETLVTDRDPELRAFWLAVDTDLVGRMDGYAACGTGYGDMTSGMDQERVKAVTGGKPGIWVRGNLEDMDLEYIENLAREEGIIV